MYLITYYVNTYIRAIVSTLSVAEKEYFLLNLTALKAFEHSYMSDKDFVFC